MSRVQLALNVADQRGARTVGALNHLDIEVDDTTCCYALQDKVWVHDPAGAPWEVYTVKDEDPANAQPPTIPVQRRDSACGSDEGAA